MRITYSLKYWPRSWLCGIWTIPPITEENYDEVMERMNEYLGEFQRHGTDHVTVELEE